MKFNHSLSSVRLSRLVYPGRVAHFHFLTCRFVLDPLWLLFSASLANKQECDDEMSFSMILIHRIRFKLKLLSNAILSFRVEIQMTEEMCFMLNIYLKKQKCLTHFATSFNIDVKQR